MMKRHGYEVSGGLVPVKDEISERVLMGEPLDNILIIDAHAHFGFYPLFFNEKTDPADIVDMMRRYGIDRICVSHLKGICSSVSEANDEIIRCMEMFPDRIWGYCFVNGNFPDQMERELGRCIGAPGFIGVKIYPGTGHDGKNHNVSINDDNFGMLWKYAVEKNFCILSHTWGHGTDASAPGRFKKILEKYPGLKLIVGHSGGCYKGHLETFELVNNYPNVYFDLTGSEEGDIWLEDIIRKIDYRKVLFGTDFGFLDPGFNIGRVSLAGIMPEQKKAIFGLNMKSLINSLY